MENLQHKKLNLEPLNYFFTEETTPESFAKLLDDFLYDYLTMLIRIQMSNFEDKEINQNTDLFVVLIKRLKDILPDCKKQ